MLYTTFNEGGGRTKLYRIDPATLTTTKVVDVRPGFTDNPEDIFWVGAKLFYNPTHDGAGRYGYLYNPSNNTIRRFTNFFVRYEGWGYGYRRMVGSALLFGTGNLGTTIYRFDPELNAGAGQLSQISPAQLTDIGGTTTNFFQLGTRIYFVAGHTGTFEMKMYSHDTANGTWGAISRVTDINSGNDDFYDCCIYQEAFQGAGAIFINHYDASLGMDSSSMMIELAP
jgi:hypothetical protein